MLEVKKSAGKHESDIPTLGMGNTLRDFFAYRQGIICTLESMENASLPQQYLGENAILPKLSAALAQPSLKAVPQQIAELVFTLEKKFVLYGTLSTHYSFEFKPTNEQTNCPEVYFFLAAILLRYFFELHDLNSLNSAIRLIDAVCRQVKADTPVSHITKLLNVLDDEKRAIMELSHA